jgi:hypothetical protein
MDNWISVDTEKPPINWIDKFDAEHKISITVLAFMKDDDRKFYFGQYYHNEIYPHWTVTGYVGFDQERITHWQYLYEPEKSHTQEEINSWDNVN